MSRSRIVCHASAIAVVAASLVAIVLPSAAGAAAHTQVVPRSPERDGKDKDECERGCTSITYTQEGSPGNTHPRLPDPLPSDWKTRNPSYGPPNISIFNQNPRLCQPGANDTQMFCPAWAYDPITRSNVRVRFKCYRHVPQPPTSPNGQSCKFHCFVDLANPYW